MNEQLKSWLMAKVRLHQYEMLDSGKTGDYEAGHHAFGKLIAYREVLEMIDRLEAN